MVNFKLFNDLNHKILVSKSNNISFQFVFEKIVFSIFKLFIFSFDTNLFFSTYLIE